MRTLGGLATFGKLNASIDFSGWGTKTPEASVRRIIQKSPAFFRIKPGLWALEENRKEIIARFDIATGSERKEDAFSHTYYQGLAVEVGNFSKVDTFVPNQDKNKIFIDKPLKEVASLHEILPFSYSEMVGRAKTIDVIWFNERRMPCAFFEIEHSTDIQNSLLKFFELQDLYAKFYIVADEYRHKKFNEMISRSVFKPIKDRVVFKSYESLSDIYEKEYRRKQAAVLL
ncbi:MAG: hypothetical protein FWF47_05785 [Clostridia bacterium]|nr:hypothetical protein [Clostridia bacterium]